ncbi:hypothetical protein B0H14DRAFT_3148704 [Mycena olivaceomarginata]|nr:hypothetical protein B0H14DRAFT_3148704 [Mycena olivaceomarginata]
MDSSVLKGWLLMSAILCFVWSTALFTVGVIFFVKLYPTISTPLMVAIGLDELIHLILLTTSFLFIAIFVRRRKWVQSWSRIIKLHLASSIVFGMSLLVLVVRSPVEARVNAVAFTSIIVMWAVEIGTLGITELYMKAEKAEKTWANGHKNSGAWTGPNAQWSDVLNISSTYGAR